MRAKIFLIRLERKTRGIRGALAPYGVFLILSFVLATVIVEAQGVNVEVDLEWEDYFYIALNWLKDNPLEFIGALVVGSVIWKWFFGKSN